MKKFKLFATSLLLLAFVGCGFGISHVEAVPSAEGDHPLVGTWEWTATNLYLYIFNADNTGSRGSVPTIQQFTWDICESGHLSMTFNNLTEHWYKEIEDGLLTIRSRQINNMQYSYRRRAGS